MHLFLVMLLLIGQAGLQDRGILLGFSQRPGRHAVIDQPGQQDCNQQADQRENYGQHHQAGLWINNSLLNQPVIHSIPSFYGAV